MDISRHASQRYHGTRLVVHGEQLRFDPANWFPSNVKWHGHLKELVISSDYNTAPDGTTRHDYKIHFSQSDVAAMLECLAHAARANPADFVQILKGHREALVTLFACAAGYALTEIPYDESNAPHAVKAIGA